MKIDRLKLLGLLLSLSLLFLLSACSLVAPEATPTAAPMNTAALPAVSVTGMLVPADYAALSVLTPGLVETLLVNEGQAVTAGTALLSLRGLAQLEAGLAGAQLELEAAQQAFATLNEQAGLQHNAAWLALLDARAQYLLAEEAWEALDTDAYQDELDAAKEAVVETEQDLEDAQDTFDRYADLESDNPLRTRYEDELKAARETYNAEARVYEDLQIALERAEANWQLAAEQVALAQTDYDATLEGPDADLLALAAARQTNAEAQVAAVQVQIENLTLRAPFAGTVTAIQIRVGEWASPGQPVLVLANLAQLQVETTDLNEIDIVQVALGDPATVTFDALPGQTFAATVTAIAPQAAPGAGVNYTVTLELAEIPAEARWGMTVFVDFDAK